MIEIGIFATAIITILGVAYPIILQVIARLDERYSSTLIIDLFEKEPIKKWFQIQLYTSLFLVLMWALKLYLCEPTANRWFIIDNSAAILVIVSTILLVTSFILLVNKVFVYSIPTRIVSYFTKNTKVDITLKYFEALTDIFINSIRRKNYPLLKTLSRFYYDEFKKVREKSNNEPVVYPNAYYEFVNKTIEEMLIEPSRRNADIEYGTAGSLWLLGEMSSYTISEQTFSWIWGNLLIAIQFQNDDMVLYHWQTANQYITYSIAKIDPDYDLPDGKRIITNATQVNKREQERTRFLEFHYALGALLLYKRKYETLNRFFRYTASDPPNYALLPESMSEVFEFFNRMLDINNFRYSWISLKYPFPEQDGVESDSVIKKWISSYITLLFLRQYTIYPYLSTVRPMDFPNIPTNQSEIKKWIDNIDFFKTLVAQHLENEKLLNITGLDVITDAWCEKQEKLNPIKFIESLKEKLERDYKVNAETLPLSADKKSQFYNTTQTKIESTLKQYKAINNIDILAEEIDRWYINGQRMLQSKDAFYENSEIHHINFDSILASILSNNINEGIASTFLFKRTKTYLFKSEDIFKAIDSLKLTDEYVIIGFGIDLDFYINHLKISHLTKKKYKNNNLYVFTKARDVGASFFILRKTDSPKILTTRIGENLITKYCLKKISGEFNLYASIIDLNQTTNEILNENKQSKDIGELKKSVLLNIFLTVEILWKKKVEVIQIQQYTEFVQKGIPNVLSDMKQVEQN